MRELLEMLYHGGYGLAAIFAAAVVYLEVQRGRVAATHAATVEAATKARLDDRTAAAEALAELYRTHAVELGELHKARNEEVAALYTARVEDMGRAARICEDVGGIALQLAKHLPAAPEPKSSRGHRGDS